MSWNSNQQLSCESCHINAEALRELAGAFKSLQIAINSIQPIINSIQPIINSIQPIINSIQPINGTQPIITGIQPTTNDIQRSSSLQDPGYTYSGDGTQSDNMDDDDVEDGTKEDTSHHTLHHSSGGSKSTARSCPHPTCAHKTQTYTQESSLNRHYNTHVKCKEICLFCGRVDTTIHKYLTHFGSCNKKENSVNWTTALKRKSELSKRGRSELRRMFEESARPGKIDVDISGGKRKTSDTGLPSQRRRVDTRGIPRPDSDASLDTGEEATPYPSGIPQWNGYEGQPPFGNSQLPNDFGTNDELFRQWPTRAGLLAGSTLDWSSACETRDHCAANANEPISLIFNSTELFTGVVTDEGYVNPMKGCDTGLMEPYEAAIS